jgi:hypothetical protein
MVAAVVVADIMSVYFFFGRIFIRKHLDSIIDLESLAKS